LLLEFRKVTIHEVKRVAARSLCPDSMTMLIMGDRGRMGVQLESPGEVTGIPLEKSRVIDVDFYYCL